MQKTVDTSSAVETAVTMTQTTIRLSRLRPLLSATGVDGADTGASSAHKGDDEDGAGVDGVTFLSEVRGSAVVPSDSVSVDIRADVTGGR